MVAVVYVKIKSLKTMVRLDYVLTLHMYKQTNIMITSGEMTTKVFWHVCGPQDNDVFSI